MSMTDPIADLLTRVRNALRVKKDTVRMPYSNLKKNLLEALQREGYIKGYEVTADGNKKDIVVFLKYSVSGLSVINELRRVSKSGCRIYEKLKDIKPVFNGIGISVVSTPKGVLSDRECREQIVGGEVLCEIW